MSFFPLYLNIVDYIGSSPREMRSVIYTSSIEHNEEDEKRREQCLLESSFDVIVFRLDAKDESISEALGKQKSYCENSTEDLLAHRWRKDYDISLICSRQSSQMLRTSVRSSLRSTHFQLITRFLSRMNALM